VSSLLDVNPGLDDDSWDSAQRLRDELVIQGMVAANFRFANGWSVNVHIPDLDGRIPEWYTWFYPAAEFKYVGMSRAHRATYFQTQH
jgi:hypothetical protein